MSLDFRARGALGKRDPSHETLEELGGLYREAGWEEVPEKALREGLAAVKGITGKAASGVGEPPEDLLIAKRIVRERREEALCAVAAVQRRRRSRLDVGGAQRP